MSTASKEENINNKNNKTTTFSTAIPINDNEKPKLKDTDTQTLDTQPLLTNTKLTDNNTVIDDSSKNTQNVQPVSLMCRICHCEETSEEYLISPCYCTGTLRYVHQSCLQQWLKRNGMKSCELCKFDFIMQTKIRSFKNWEKLDMNNIERRKILCSVTFHAIAITCVIWSLYVLIQKTADEIVLNKYDWGFWTKLIVVAIGFTGGVVFMYIQCKMYFQLCMRWRQYNRMIIIQPITDELLKNSKKKQLEKYLNNSNSKTNNNKEQTCNTTSTNNTNSVANSNPNETIIHLSMLNSQQT